ncbi:hypothetical protein QQ008_14255 [Fulvivirgaceae bacterium BMA10]|uniref:DUF481 domain-containing protein n=1 Tax=Splendidivirga corallicola TaxID=3051826 RepID=A0ABT8KP97_9BACT|nr:hypothetical protein [Fulvivirgaceae bacterium BMA10]
MAMKKVIKISFFSFVLTLFISLLGFSQTESVNKNHLGIVFGNSNFHSRDQMLSPLNYRGNNFNTTISYTNRRTKGFHTAEVLFSIGDINTNVDHFTMNGIRTHISYGYRRELSTIKLKNTEIPFFIGGIIKSFLNIKISDNEDAFTWMFVNSLNISIGAEYRNSPRHSFLWQFHFPLISYVLRPPYAGSDEFLVEDPWEFKSSRYGDVAFINKYFMLANILTYQYGLSSRFDLVVKYQFQYHQYDQPRSVKMYVNLVSGGLNFKL